MIGIEKYRVPPIEVSILDGIYYFQLEDGNNISEMEPSLFDKPE